MSTGKIDLLKEKIKKDPLSYYRMRAKYHEGLLDNLKFQVTELVDVKLAKDINRVSRKLNYYNNKIKELEGNENS